jgi:hypothetical protein
MNTKNKNTQAVDQININIDWTKTNKKVKSMAKGKCFACTGNETKGNPFLG